MVPPQQTRTFKNEDGTMNSDSFCLWLEGRGRYYVMKYIDIDLGTLVKWKTSQSPLEHLSHAFLVWLKQPIRNLLNWLS